MKNKPWVSMLTIIAIASAAQPVYAENIAADAKTSTATHSHMLSDADLAQHRGGEAIAIADQTLAGIVDGNRLNGDYTAGDVILSDNALSGFNGIGNLVINTGAQSLLQSGMNLTINLNE